MATTTTPDTFPENGENELQSEMRTATSNAGTPAFVIGLNQVYHQARLTVRAPSFP